MRLVFHLPPRNLFVDKQKTVKLLVNGALESERPKPFNHVVQAMYKVRIVSYCESLKRWEIITDYWVVANNR